MDAILEVKGLRCSFDTRRGTVRAVDGVDFRVRKGEMMALVGESGCGKSVTAQAIMGAHRPESRRTGGGGDPV